MAKVGRPKGSTKPKTVPYHRRVRPEWVKILDEVIHRLKMREVIKENIAKGIYK